MARTEPRWSLITVTYNSARAIETFWSSVELGEDVEWVVVDNASTDHSRQVAAELGARVIALDVNRGFGAANNLGFRASSSPYVCFVNPDVTPQIADLARLDALLEGEERLLVAPQLLNEDGSRQPNGRGVPSLLHKVLHRVRPGLVEHTYRRSAAEGEVVEVDWVMGAVVAGRRDWLSRLGPWDERFFVYYEDSDLGLRNARGGGRTTVVGDVRWVHGWQRETATVNWRAWRREVPSMVKFYSRYPELLSLSLPRASRERSR
jgi:GT2 family glycosyltransferase